MTFTRNPDIRRARAQWRAAIEKIPQAKALPDPSFQVLHWVESVETRVGPQEQAFTLTQKIPWPAKLANAGRVAEAGARIAALRYSAVVRDALAAAKASYYEYSYLVRARELVRQNQEIAARLAGLGAEMMAEDRALLIDVLKAQSQLAQLQYDLITLEELIAAERTRLNGLMNRQPDEPIPEPPEPLFPRLVISVDRLFQLAMSNREEIRIADRTIQQACARLALAHSQARPDFTLGGTWIRVGENSAAAAPPPHSGKDAWGVVLGVSIPLWANKNAAVIRQADAERDAAVAGRASVVVETKTMIQDAYTKLSNAERLVLLYRDSLVPQAEQVMLSTEELAREDRMRLGDYLEAQTVWLNFTLAKERALADYQQAIARLERLTGANLAPSPPQPPMAAPTEEESR
jgi:outer membrane protein TolC